MVLPSFSRFKMFNSPVESVELSYCRLVLTTIKCKFLCQQIGARYQANVKRCEKECGEERAGCYNTFFNQDLGMIDYEAKIYLRTQIEECKCQCN